MIPNFLFVPLDSRDKEHDKSGSKSSRDKGKSMTKDIGFDLKIDWVESFYI